MSGLNYILFVFFITDILTSKRRQYSDLAHRINETKAQIDRTRVEVERKRTERLTMGKLKAMCSIS